MKKKMMYAHFHATNLNDTFRLPYYCLWVNFVLGCTARQSPAAGTVPRTVPDLRREKWYNYAVFSGTRHVTQAQQNNTIFLWKTDLWWVV